MLKFLSPRQGWRWLTVVVLAAACCFAQKDPGPRGGASGAGGTFPTLDPNAATNQADTDFFLQTLERFKEVDSVSGTIEAGVGLGPAFNHNSCAACHIQPAVGGSSPAVFSKGHRTGPHLRQGLYLNRFRVCLAGSNWPGQ